MKEVNIEKLPSISYSAEEQEIVNLSQKKWQWMANRGIEAIGALFKVVNTD
ncbi:hypothetical protein [Flavobacterium subsaxonicum]|uniref:hypothetical protein n=1 Tax=Flavobacterium subsaxonicum TaxID=426226 RepID=UPI0003FFA23B|nr:hypothetical protein [Flavobacterium subsaxonicum]